MSKLFREFPPVSTEQWMEVVQKDLKGQDFQKRLVSKTLDGLEIRPFYRKEDVAQDADCAPGQTRYRRGYRTDSNDWQNREQIREDNLDAANAHAVRALMSGAQELSVLCYPIGVPIRSQADLEKFLSGVYLEMVSIHWMAGPFSPEVYAMLLNEAARRGLPSQQLAGSLDFDPILDSASGWVNRPMEDWKAGYLPILSSMLEKTPAMSVLTIRGSLIEKSGASAAQELAFTLSLLSEYLSGIQDAGFDLNEVAPRIELRHAVGSHYFLEIAKLRAHRILVQNVLDAFGITAGRPHVHVDTTSSNKTLYDPYNNLLRATVEGMAAVMAGVDSLSVAAFDQGYHSPDEFSEHIARNTETLLKEEAFLAKVVDPLGGSYYVENLTDSLAKAAWELFQKIEGMGGFIVAWKSGFIAGELDRVRAEKVKRINSRRTPIVGTSVYPNLKERRLEDVKPFPVAKTLRPWNEVHASLDELQSKLALGETRDHWETNQSVPSTALNSFRPSWTIEHLRLRVERYTASGSKRPLVYLAKAGDPARAKARATFSLGFLGAGGYDAFEPIAAQPIDQAIADAVARGADLVVVCAADPDYAELVPVARQALDAAGSGAKIVVAGYPEESLEQLKADGVVAFIHLKSDLVKTLDDMHRMLGIPEVAA